MDHSGAESVFASLSNYSLASSQRLKKSLQQLTLTTDEQRDAFSKQCSKLLRKTFQHILKTNPQQPSSLPTLQSLMLTLFHGVMLNRLKLSLLLTLLDDMSECLSVHTLRSIFELVQQHISQLENVSANDQNTLLRITNSMLKRISKAQDVEFRGRLHIALSKVLRLCHESGVKGKGMASGSDVQVDTEWASGGVVTYRMYQRFWGVQKYFSEPALLSEEAIDKSIQDQPTTTTTNNTTRPYLTKLQSIQSLLTDILKVFENNPVSHEGHRGHQPIKYLSRANLLETQLNDSYFRKLFLTQALFFCFNLRNQSVNVKMKDDEKHVVNEMEKKVREGLAEVSRNLGEDPLCPKLDAVLVNQKNWIDLKQNWKQRKKTLFQPPNQQITQQLQYLTRHELDQDQSNRNLYNQLINPHTRRAAHRHMQILSQIMLKMKTQGLQFLDLLKQNNQHRQLQTTPLQPAFESYFDEAAKTLKSFQEKGSMSDEFETKGAYIAYEWKAMRALYRENLREAAVVEKKGGAAAGEKLREFRLLGVVRRRLEEGTKDGSKQGNNAGSKEGSKEGEITDEPHKKQKTE